VSVPVWLGRLVPGDNKELANIYLRRTESDGLIAVARKHDGGAIVDAQWSATSDLQPATESPAFMKNFAASFDLPHIGKWPKDGPGPYHCFPQDYHIEKAQVHGVKGAVRVQAAFGGVQEGRFDFESIDSQEFGGFRFRSHWEFTSTLPVNCKTFDPAVPSSWEMAI